MQTRTMAAVIAIVCAIVAFFSRPVLGFFLALAAVFFGLIGTVRAVSPQMSGGFLSLVAVLLGAIGVVVKILEGALRLIF